MAHPRAPSQSAIAAGLAAHGFAALRMEDRVLRRFIVRECVNDSNAASPSTLDHDTAPFLPIRSDTDQTSHSPRSERGRIRPLVAATRSRSFNGALNRLSEGLSPNLRIKRT